MLYCVYAIKSLTHDYIYVGITNSVPRRFGQHNRGKEQTTRPYRPFRLIYTENCPDRPAARLLEKYFKSGCGKEWLKKL